MTTSPSTRQRSRRPPLASTPLDGGSTTPPGDGGIPAWAPESIPPGATAHVGSGRWVTKCYRA